MRLKDCACILLAGGNSSRTSIPKGLLKLGSRSLLEHQVERLHALKFNTLVVVLGAHAYLYRPVIEKTLVKPQLVLNPKPEEGPFSSVKLGLESLNKELPTFILPLDVPSPSSPVWTLLIEQLENKSVAIPYCKGRGGHPVLLSYSFQKALLEVELNSLQARLDTQIHLLDPSQKKVVPVEEETILWNLNFDSDWKAYEAACGY